MNVLINVFKLIFFFKFIFIFVWRLCHDIFDVINVNNEWTMLTNSFNHLKCSKKKLITSQRSRFVSREKSLSSRAKTAKERRRSVELTCKNIPLGTVMRWWKTWIVLEELDASYILYVLLLWNNRSYDDIVISFWR